MENSNEQHTSLSRLQNSIEVLINIERSRMDNDPAELVVLKRMNFTKEKINEILSLPPQRLSNEDMHIYKKRQELQRYLEKYRTLLVDGKEPKDTEKICAMLDLVDRIKTGFIEEDVAIIAINIINTGHSVVYRQSENEQGKMITSEVTQGIRFKMY